MRMLDGRKDMMFEDDGDDEMTAIILMLMTVRYIVKWSRFFCNVPRFRRFPSFATFATFATPEVVVEMIDIAQEIVMSMDKSLRWRGTMPSMDLTTSSAGSEGLMQACADVSTDVKISPAE